MDHRNPRFHNYAALPRTNAHIVNSRLALIAGQLTYRQAMQFGEVTLVYALVKCDYDGWCFQG